MGLFDFVREAGRKIFGRAEEPEAETRELSAEALAAADRAKAAALAREVGSHDLGIEGLEITFSNGVATVRGTAKSQADREKVVLAVGNVLGVAQVDDQMTVEAEPEAQFYTVVRGDTLSKIAKEFYGKASKYPVIFEANRPMLSHPDKIYPGQVLRIPPIKDEG